MNWRPIGFSPSSASHWSGSIPWSDATTPRLVEALYLDGYRIRFTYADGTVGVIDLESELWGEVFEPLKDLARFREFRLDPELQTIVWPNGADFAPEFLYERASA